MESWTKSDSFKSVESVLTMMGETICSFPPIQFMVIFFKALGDFLMDRMVLILLSFILGMVVLLAIEALVLWTYYKSTPVEPPPKFEDTRLHLPQALKARLGNQSLKKKEECVWLNFFMHFMFSELRDSLRIRRFLTNKIQMEFEDVLKSKTGVLVDELFLRDFSLGENFPVIMGMSVDKSDVKNEAIQTLDLKVQLAYDGGFEIAIDAALPFSRMANVSVKVLKLKGMMRLRFTLLPFSHWNMSFYEEPELDVEVTAQLDGRPMPKLKTIIASQIRRIVRKKHTLPMYKIRCKPFFMLRPEPVRWSGRHLTIGGKEIGQGILEVTIISASRLPFVVKEAKMYCTLSIDPLPWKQMMAEERKRKKVITLALVRHIADQSLGMTVKDELLPDRLHPVVVIEEVTLGFPAHLANVQKGDILIGVGGTKVLSAKQAMKNFKWAKDNKILIQVERPQSESDGGSSKDDATMPRKVSSWHYTTGSDFGGSSDSESVYSLNSNGAPFVSHSLGAQSDPNRSSKIPPDITFKRKPTDYRKTTFREATEDPYWNQKFIFGVDADSNFLNVCVWSKGGDRTGKPDALGTAKEDVLIGYISLNLDDVYLHCLITLNGTMQDKVKLKHGHYKTEAELIKTWSIHKGWDPNQMYGDILLGFHFFPTVLTQNQRQSLSGSKAGSTKLKKELFEQQYGKGSDEQDKETVQKSRSEAYNKSNLNQGHHQFDSTSFITATFCDYCGKKIWMKEAFKCRTCSMVCHKKCLVKCLLNTFCTDGGVKKRSALDEAWEPLTVSGKVKAKSIENLMSKTAFGDLDEINSEELEAAMPMGFDSETVAEDWSEVVERRAGVKKTESESPGNRFRVLKDQTEKMKDNVMKHLKRNKVSNAMNDKAIMSAKEIGARLFIDLEPAQRKDRLEDMVKKLDEQLKAEMENKEAIENELAALETQDQKSSSLKRRSEIRSLQNKAQKSAEKQDAMRLLMLQYCTGLQTCINTLESEAHSTKSGTASASQSYSDPKSETKSEPARPSRSAAVGGFMRRASSSVKEKVSSIKKDFGRKGSKNPDDQPSTSKGKNNNSDLNTISERDEVLKQINVEGVEQRRNARSKSVGHVEGLVMTSELEGDLEGLDTTAEAPPILSSSHPAIEIRIDDVDEASEEVQTAGGAGDQNEPRALSREDVKITRSSSDSGLEINKMLNLSPEDILRYHSASLPRLLLTGDDSDSDSDFLVLDSSDEPAMSDSSDSDLELETVDFEGGLSVNVEGAGKKPEDADSDDDGSEQHRASEQLKTYKV